MPSSRFNLVDDPWIPVVYADGRTATVSLRQAFADAPSIHGLSGDIPLQAIPMLDVMLAILYRAAPFPAQGDLRAFWRRVWDSGRLFTDEIDEYLDAFHDRFCLFDDEHPFYQAAGLEYASRGPDGIGELVGDVPKPEKFLFSMRDQGHLDSLDAAEAARWLVFQQGYALAGIKSPVRGSTHVVRGKVLRPKGFVGTGLLGAQGNVCLEGRSLFETLMLNWVLCDEGRGLSVGDASDVPAWERESPSADQRVADPGEPCGIVSALTWQSRRMRLVASEDGTRVVSVVCCYGDLTQLMDRPDVATMTAWRLSPSQQKARGLGHVPLVPLLHEPSRAAWRGLSALVAARPDSPDLRPGVMRWIDDLLYRGILSEAEVPMVVVRAQGLAYDQYQCAIEDAIDDRLELGATLARHDLPSWRLATEVVDQTDRAVRALARFVANVETARGSRCDDATRALRAQRASEAAYGRLDGVCRERIARFPADADAALPYCDDWRRQVRDTVVSLANGHVRMSDVPMFEQHGDMTAGRAWCILLKDLDKALKGR